MIQGYRTMVSLSFLEFLAVQAHDSMVLGIVPSPISKSLVQGNNFEVEIVYRNFGLSTFSTK
jgi:hypothetical protein